MKSRNSKAEAKTADISPRAKKRFAHEVSVAYSLEVEQNIGRKFTRYMFGTLVDISDRGICFKAKDTFASNKVISLYLKLSDKTDGLKMLGKVVWVKPEQDGQARVGVKFIGALPPNWIKLLPTDKTQANSGR